MNEILIALSIGCCAGIIDIVPMIKQKLNKFSIYSAFVQWVVLGLVIPNTKMFGLTSWLNGLVVAVLFSLPIVTLVMENDRRSVPIIISMSAILGSLVGLIGFNLGL